MMIMRAALAAALAFGLLAAPLDAEAQQAGKAFRVGYLGNSSASLEPDLVEALRQGLRNLSYVENQNIIIEYRWAEGRYDRFPSLVADLIQHQVDVIVTAGTPGTLAAKQATRTIPIVMAVSADAVGVGLVDSLARPGANVTGLTTMVQDERAPLNFHIMLDTTLGLSRRIRSEKVVDRRDLGELPCGVLHFGLANTNTLRQRPPAPWPRPPDRICQTRTLTNPGAGCQRNPVPTTT